MLSSVSIVSVFLSVRFRGKQGREIARPRVPVRLTAVPRVHDPPVRRKSGFVAARGKTGVPADSVCGLAEPREWDRVVQETGDWA